MKNRFRGIFYSGFVALIVAATVTAYGEDIKDRSVVSLDVREVQSFVWPAGKGHFRVINFWKDLAPRLLVQSISDDSLLYSKELRSVEIDKVQTDLSDESLDAFIDEIHFSEGELKFQVEAFPSGGSYVAECKVKLEQQVAPGTPKCERQKNE